MTSVSVNEFLSSMPEIPTVNPSAQTSNSDFSETFHSASDKMNEKANKNGNDLHSKKNNGVDAAKDASMAMKKARKNETAESKKEVASDYEQMKSAEEAAYNMVQAVAEAVEAEPEEVMKAMDDLGLTVDDLFTKEGLGMVLTELEGLDNPILLVTDQELFGKLSELGEEADQILASLQNDLGLNQEELSEVLKEYGELVSQNSEDPNEGLKNINETDYVEAVAGNQVEAENIENVSAGNRTESDKNSNKENHDSDKGQPVVQPNFVAETAEIEIPAEASENGAMTRMSAQEIFDQIGDYIKTLSNGDMDSVEMQLHPESLGTLQIKVTSKGGNVTASLIAQNEAVKAALETQMVALKESFEEQGIKVEAVEVSVATHQFESAMQQNENRQEQNPSEAKRPSVRSLNLNEALDEEDLTEEEQIAVEMMAANGNTVDYKA